MAEAGNVGGMPEPVRQGLLTAAVSLAAVAAVGNFGHAFAFAVGGGQGQGEATVVALTPDILIFLGVLRLRYTRRVVWAWAGLLSSVAFVVWASVATAGHGVTGRLVSVWPVWVAVVAAGLIEARAKPVEVAAADPKPKREPSTGRGHGRVTPQVTPPAAQQAVGSGEPVGLHPVPDPGDRAGWVRGRLGKGHRPGVIISEGMARFGVSEATMKRELRAARQGQPVAS